MLNEDSKFMYIMLFTFISQPLCLSLHFIILPMAQIVFSLFFSSCAFSIKIKIGEIVLIIIVLSADV